MSAEVEHTSQLNPMPNQKENPRDMKRKQEENQHFTSEKKCLKTFSDNSLLGPLCKRSKHCDEKNHSPTLVLDNKVCDLLKINIIQDKEANQAINDVTPKSESMSTPKQIKEKSEVIVLPNICDPLGINITNCEEYEKQLISSTEKTCKSRRRKRSLRKFAKKNIILNEIEDNIAIQPTILEENNVSSNTEDQICIKDESKEKKLDIPQKDEDKLKLKNLEQVASKKSKKPDVKDKIVSASIPQPGTWKKKKKQQQKPEFKPKNERFRYGNYNRYYGYRNPNHVADLRLTALAKRKELFKEKEVLDIGCNTGQVTLAIASEYEVKSMTGIDIDPKLIKIARKNIPYYIKPKELPKNDLQTGEDKKCTELLMPMNDNLNRVPGLSKENKHKGFPYNVTFIQGNYVLDDSSLLDSEQQQFDTIMCLSTTKWIHLNFGDDGLKRAFKRMFRQLRPGGILILEPQSWNSYEKKKKLTEQIYTNYHNIKFHPNDFMQYLLSSKVGFKSFEVLSVASHPSKGFQRPIHIYTKGLNEECKITKEGS